MLEHIFLLRLGLYVFLVVFVCFCLFLFVFVCFCLFLFVFVCFCLFLFLFVFEWGLYRVWNHHLIDGHRIVSIVLDIVVVVGQINEH